jgi:hypothetical protein
MWVSCYTGVELRLRGVLGGCEDSFWAAWDNVCYLYRCPDDRASASCLDGFDLPVVTMHFDSLPDSFPRRSGDRITVTGHFDNPAAEDCAVQGDPGLGFSCRTHFVVTAYR